MDASPTWTEASDETTTVAVGGTGLVVIYVALMDGRYPSTDERRSVRLELRYPDARRDVNRWLPLVKWTWWRE